MKNQLNEMDKGKRLFIIYSIILALISFSVIGWAIKINIQKAKDMESKLINKGFKKEFETKTQKLYYKVLINNPDTDFTLFVRLTSEGKYESCFIEEEAVDIEYTQQVRMHNINEEYKFWLLYEMLK